MSSFLKYVAGTIFFVALTAPAAMAQVDIKSYGARCDGSDDSAAVQAAINAVGSGGTVTISCSAGIGSRGILLAGKSNVTVAGSGGNAGFRALAPTGQNSQGFGPVMFLIQNCAGCVVRDLVIDVQNVGVDAIGFDRCTNSTLQNVSVSNTAYPANAAIVATQNTGNSYIGNTVRFTSKSSTDGTRGMWIGNGNSQTEVNATIANNTVSDTGATGIVGHVINSTIKNNLVTNTSGAGIKIVPTPGMGGQSTISGNTLRGNLFHGVQIENADSPVIVQGNTIDANVISGIYVSGGRYTNGRITGNTITNHKEAGIYLYNFEGLSIDNNTLAGNGHGILIESNSGTMHDLQITSNTMTGQQAHGITMWGRGGVVQNVAINANSISNGLIYGLFLEQTSGSLTGISTSSNCFSNNAAGSIFDNRGMIAPVAQSGSCAPAGGGTTPTADKTAPSVSIAAPSNGATVSGTVTVAANATDNVGVTGVQFLLNGDAFGPKLTSAPYSVQWDTRTATNGSYQWAAVAQDAAGNATTSAVSFANVSNADTTAPTVRILTPAGGSSVTGTVAVTSSASDNVGVAAVQYTLDGAPLGAETTVSPYNYSWNTSGLANGAHTLTATARDAAGNRTSASVTVTMSDTTAPTVRILTPANGSTVAGTVAVTASASDNVGVAGVQYSVDGAPLGGEVTASPYSYSWNTSGLATGAHTLTATARDAAGNRTSTSVSVTMTDTAAPTVRILTPANGSTVAGTVAVTASASDNVGVAGVQYSLDGAALGAELAASPYTYSWNAGSLSAGTHTLTATARDAAGNRTSASITVTKADTTGPAVAITSPASGQTVSGNVTVSATASDNVGVAGVQYLVDGAAFGGEVAGGTSVTWNSAAAANGAHTISAIARDAAGNRTTSAAVSVNVVNTSGATTTTTTIPFARMNVCGGSFTDPSGNVWSPDSGSNGGHCDNFSSKSVSGTTTPSLYQTQRWNNGTLTYTIPATNGTYTVNLKFAELYFTAPRQRVFNIAINGQTVQTGFDIVAAAGGPGKAIDKSYNVSVTNGSLVITMASTIDDPAVNAIEILKTATTTVTPPPVTNPPVTNPPATTTTALARINVCGGSFTDPSGNVWSADTGFNGGHCDNFSSKTVSGTTTPSLYQTQRWNNGTLIYTFAAPNGTYAVNLKFAEMYFTAARQRMFNISINGQTVETAFDIVAAAGGPGKAIDKSYTVAVTNGSIVITMVSTVDDPAVNAIEILSSSTTTTTPPPPTTTTPVAVARINACGGAYTDAGGSVWSADSGSNGGYCDNFSSKTVGGTTSQALYQTQRWRNSQLAYTIPVANGTYTVNLKFAELYFTSAGQRKFNITINGQAVATGFDIVAAAGGAGKAIDKSFTVPVTTGAVSIVLVSTVDDPAINAIEVLKN